MKIMVINGPCMNTGNNRESARRINESLLTQAVELGINCEFFQGNSEGDLVSLIQSAWNTADGIILNAGDYSHYSIAIRDAISSVKKTPVIEVNLANVHAQEGFDRVSMLAPVCKGVITGFGEDCYFLALHALASEFAQCEQSGRRPPDSSN